MHIFYIAMLNGNGSGIDVTLTDEDTTQCKMEVRILSGGFTKNLMLHGMSKIDFQPEFRNAVMLSFLMMYNTMGSKVDGLAVREHFL